MLKTVERKLLRTGVLIAIEGIDAAGKTTQSKILYEKLTENGYPVVLLHEPTEGKWGKKIRELAMNGRHKITPETELDFFFQDRLEDVKDNIRPALKRKEIVIMDRYYFSSVAYQGARGLDSNDIEKKNEKIAPKPDVTIILDIYPQVATKRIKQKRNSSPNHFEREKYLNKVRQVFLKQFSKRSDVKIIEGDDKRSISIVASEIWKTVEPIVRKLEET